MEDLRQAIKARLSGDATLAALAPGGVFYGKAPQAAVFPFVIFSQSASVRRSSFGQANAGDTDRWMIKGVARERVSQASLIDARARALMTDPTLALNANVLLYCRPEGAMPQQPETDNGETFYQIGTIYRIEIEPLA